MRDGLRLVHQIGKDINRCVAASEPWKLDNDGARHELSHLLIKVEALALGASPVVPETSRRILTTLGRPSPTTWQLDAAPLRLGGPPERPL